MKRLLFITLPLLTPFLALAQVTTTGGLTPSQYVNDVLLGNGVTASNVTYTGHPDGIAKFTAPAGTNLGFSSGLFLTSGSHVGAQGPAGPADNEQDVQQVPSVQNDHDLHMALDALGYDTTITPSPGMGVTNDISILEFDFVPTSDSISFRYRFASEEYNDWVEEQPNAFGFNDIFAFLLKGVSPAAAAQYPQYQNVALIPGTTTPVSIFTVNNGFSQPGEESDGPCMNCAYYVDNVNTAVDVIYDGITTILTAKAPVICGQTYHIKLAIADAMDQALDSGVFIEGGSFSSAGSMQVVSSVNFGPNDSTLVENCNSGTVTLVRTDVATAQNISVIYTGSTAGLVADFGGLPAVMHFNAGEDSVQINLQALADGISENTEDLYIGFIVPSTCGNTFDTLMAHFVVHDASQMDVNAGNDIITCNGGAINENVTAVVTGGYGTITYDWNTGANTAAINVTAEGEYIITVTDQCSQSATDTVTASVVVPVALNVALEADFSVCAGTTVTLTATPTGGNGTITYAWSNGATGNPISFTANNSNTTLTVTATDQCGLTATDNISISASDVDANFSVSIEGMGNAIFTNQSQPDNLDYQWDFGDGSGSTEENPQHTYGMTGNYTITLTVSNADGCKDAITQLVEYKVPSEVFIPNTFTPNSDGMNDFWLISMSYIENFQLYVYDRWGQLVFETDDLFTYWKGTYYNTGKPLKDDRYSYRIQYQEFKGPKKQIMGSVTLLR